MAIDPFTVGAILTAGSALGNVITGIYAAKEARRINEETFQRLMQTAKDYEAEMQGNLPSGSVTPIQFEEFKQTVQDYIPEIFKQVPEAVPQQITESGVAPEIQAQKEALRQYGRMAQTGYDPIAAAQQEAALTASAAQASAARQAGLREAAQRGMGGTGLDVLSGLGAAEQAAVAGRQAALQAQAEAGQRRMQALGAYGTLAGQIRQAGTQTEQANVNIMNAFNERMSRNLNQYNQYVAELKNQSTLQNRAEKQRMAEMQVEAINKQRVLEAQRQQQAEESRRAAKERMFTTKHGIESGMAELGGKMRGQELSRDILPYQQISSTAGKVGETMLGSYYDKNKPEKKE